MLSSNIISAEARDAKLILFDAGTRKFPYGARLYLK